LTASSYQPEAGALSDHTGGADGPLFLEEGDGPLRPERLAIFVQQLGRGHSHWRFSSEITVAMLESYKGKTS
jgi:hypothetical protein